MAVLIHKSRHKGLAYCGSKEGEMSSRWDKTTCKDCFIEGIYGKGSDGKSNKPYVRALASRHYFNRYRRDI